MEETENNQNKQSLLSDESYLLAMQAFEEMKTTGSVKIICPKCGQNPVVELEEHRFTVLCPCKYVFTGEVWS